MTEIARTCWLTAARCPQCGAALATNGSTVWCTFIGGRDQAGVMQRACDYGLTERRVPYDIMQHGVTVSGADEE